MGPPPAVCDDQAMEVEVYRHPHHQCSFHSPHPSMDAMTVDISGGRPVHDVWKLDDEFRSLRYHLFGCDDRGADELQERLRSDFVQGKVRILCARTTSGANRMWHTECTACRQFNHVEYGSWACQTPAEKAAKRQQMFLWHTPPIESAPRIAAGAALPAGRPTV